MTDYVSDESPIEGLSSVCHQNSKIMLRNDVSSSIFLVGSKHLEAASVAALGLDEKCPECPLKEWMM